MAVAEVNDTIRWRQAALVGLGAALVGGMALLAAGAYAGRGVHILADVGQAALPSAVRTVTGASAALSYVLSHTLLYLLGAVAAMALARLADGMPQIMPGFVLALVLLELGFLVLTTEGRILGRFDEVTWRALLVAHATGDLALVFGIVRIHPGLRQALSRGYED
jgi:hypothetical protein